MTNFNLQIQDNKDVRDSYVAVNQNLANVQFLKNKQSKEFQFQMKNRKKRQQQIMRQLMNDSNCQQYAKENIDNKKFQEPKSNQKNSENNGRQGKNLLKESNKQNQRQKQNISDILVINCNSNRPQKQEQPKIEQNNQNSLKELEAQRIFKEHHETQIMLSKGIEEMQQTRKNIQQFIDLGKNSIENYQNKLEDIQKQFDKLADNNNVLIQQEIEQQEQEELDRNTYERTAYRNRQKIAYKYVFGRKLPADFDAQIKEEQRKTAEKIKQRKQMLNEPKQVVEIIYDYNGRPLKQLIQYPQRQPVDVNSKSNPRKLVSDKASITSNNFMKSSLNRKSPRQVGSRQTRDITEQERLRMSEQARNLQTNHTGINSDSISESFRHKSNRVYETMSERPEKLDQNDLNGRIPLKFKSKSKPLEAEQLFFSRETSCQGTTNLHIEDQKSHRNQKEMIIRSKSRSTKTCKRKYKQNSKSQKFNSNNDQQNRKITSVNQSRERVSIKKEDQIHTQENEEVLEDDSDDYQDQADKQPNLKFRNSLSASDKFQPKIIYNKQQKKCRNNLVKNLAVNNYIDSGSENRQNIRRSKDLTIQPAIINQQKFKIINLPNQIGQVVKKERPQSFLFDKPNSQSDFGENKFQRIVNECQAYNYLAN